MKVVVTGAGGFVGQALSRELAADDSLHVVLVDNRFPPGMSSLPGHVRLVEGQLQDRAIRRAAVRDGIDVLFHLAAVPGGAAEADPALSKAVNLDATLALFEEVASFGKPARVVFTSTIAVLGAPLPAPVTDDCRIAPAMVYGAHKAMVELALADMARRGLLDPVAVRLPGIVARPAAPSGLKSAFMSNVFHALKAGDSFVSPVSPSATFWLMSVKRCVANVLHASRLDSSKMPSSRVVTLPALRCTMGELVASIAGQCNRPAELVRYEPDAELEAHFGTQPPLETPTAEQAGFAHDGSLLRLVRAALATPS